MRRMRAPLLSSRVRKTSRANTPRRARRAAPVPPAEEGRERSEPGEGRELSLDGCGAPSSVAFGDPFSREREKGLPSLLRKGASNASKRAAEAKERSVAPLPPA